MRKVNRCIAAIGAFFLLLSCDRSPNSNSLAGHSLAKTYCSSCHLFPEPELLAKSQWRNVLPRMGARLGMQSDSFDPYKDKSMQTVFQLQSEGIYPTNPVLSIAEWEKIQDYFLQKAPDVLKLPPITNWKNQQLFKESSPEIPLSGFPSLTMLEVDTFTHKLYLSDWNGNFLCLTQDFSVESQTLLPQPLIDLVKSEEGTLTLLSIGQLYPNEAQLGAVVSSYEKRIYQQNILFSKLRRPVHVSSSDLDNDGQEDLLVCSFGNMLGNLSWYQKTGNTYTEHVIKSVPGATKVYVEDLDANGFEDLVVLFAQGDEGISIFYNDKGSFIEKKILRFHPLFGSNDFEFLDFDKDGYKDILMTNGDNGDHSNVLKPYHGLRIFLNKGNNEFREQFFFPFYGASKVKSYDFDKDGDMDILLASFFPDFKIGGSQSLVYLENKGNWQFEPYKIKAANQGRWMLMDAADLDDDGDEDVLLGSFVLNSDEIDPALLNSWRNGELRILYLENQIQ